MTSDPQTPSPPPAFTEFAATVSQLLRWVEAATEVPGRGNEVMALLRRHLGGTGAAASVVVRDLPPFEQVNLQAERTDGVTASFIKELLRRAVLESLTETPGSLTTVSGAHLARALDDPLDSTQSVTRALLGVPTYGGG